MIILGSQITSRMLVYYAILIMLVPYVAAWSLKFFDFIGVDEAFLSFDVIFDKFAPDFMQHWRANCIACFVLRVGS
jgi:hypothetical protein